MIPDTCDGDSGAKYKGRQNETRMEIRREGWGHCWRKEACVKLILTKRTLSQFSILMLGFESRRIAGPVAHILLAKYQF